MSLVVALEGGCRATDPALLTTSVRAQLQSLAPVLAAEGRLQAQDATCQDLKVTHLERACAPLCMSVWGGWDGGSRLLAVHAG
jgi:hypothetical protein